MSDKLVFHVGDDEELSEAVQRLLFALGYEWPVNKKEVIFNRQFIFARPSGTLSWLREDEFPDENVGGKMVDWVKPKNSEVQIQCEGRTITLSRKCARELGLVD